MVSFIEIEEVFSRLPLLYFSFNYNATIRRIPLRLTTSSGN